MIGEYHFGTVWQHTLKVMEVLDVSGLSDDDIYNIVKAVWENRDEWAGCAKSVQTQTVLDTVLEEIAIPMHPGAIRYFEEIGIEVPDNLK